MHRPMHRSLMLALLAALTGALLLAPTLAPVAADQGEAPDRKPDQKPERARQLEWGVYQIHWGAPRFLDGLDAQTRQLGAAPQLAMFFRDMSPRRGFPTRTCEALAQRGITPVISLELTTWGRRSTNHLPGIARGDHDAWLRAWGQAAKAHGKPVILRFGFEMNGDWFAWGEQPELFVQGWRRARKLIRDEAGATNVRWMLAPNALWDKRTPEKDLQPYWPGDDQVELVGFDGYNFGDDHSKWHRWVSYEHVFARSIAYAHERWRKPIYLSEIGCADDARKAAWVADFLAKVTADRRVTGFIWFNFDKRREREPNWRLDSDAQSLKHFRRWVVRQRAGAEDPTGK